MEAERKAKGSGDATKPTDSSARARGRASLAGGRNKRCYYLVDKQGDLIPPATLNEVYNETYIIWEGWVNTGIAPRSKSHINVIPLIVNDFCARLRARWPQYFTLCADDWKAIEQILYRYNTFLNGDSKDCIDRQRRLAIAQAKCTGVIALDSKNPLLRMKDEDDLGVHANLLHSSTSHTL